jgi:fatty acid synthase, animal type
LNMMRCGGVEICGLITGPMARRKQPKHVLESYSFVSHLPAPKMSICDALRLVVQLAMDNLTFEKLRIMEVDCENKDPVVPTLKTVLNDLPHSGFELFLQTQRHFSFVQVRVGLAARSNCTLVIASNCLTHASSLEIAQQSLCAKGYILSRETSGVSLTAPPGCQLIAAFPTENETYLLLQAQGQQPKSGARVVKASAEDFTWLTEVRQAMKTGSVVVVAENETLTGAVGLVGCVRKERNGHRVSAVVIEDAKAPPFDMNHPLYKNQLNMGLAVNIFKDVSCWMDSNY